MPSERQTYPYDPQPTYKDTGQVRESVFNGCRRPPTSAFAALMEAAPGDEPEESWDEKQERLDPIRDALESGVLDDRETWVIEALFWRRVGLRAVAQELALSKTHVARIRDDALSKLRNQLEVPTP